MDVGEFLHMVRMPRLPQRKAASPRASRGGDRPVVGVDLEPGFLAAAQVSVNGRVQIERAGAIALAPEVVRDGEVIDGVALSSALSELFGEHKFDRHVRLGIANQRIVIRMLELPPINNQAELAAAVRFQAQDELPMSLDSAVLDYHALGVHETPAGPRLRVALVAARREMVERLVSAAREAGLRPVGVDLAAFALIRSLHVPGSAEDERVVYLSAGGLGNLAVAQGRICTFTRVLSVGLESIAGDLAERLGVAVPEARDLLLRADLGPALDERVDEVSPFAASSAFEVESSPFEVDDEATLPTRAVPDAADPLEIARAVLADGVRRIGVEVRNSLHYHALHGGDQGATRVVVSGVMSQIRGFNAALAGELDLEVVAGEVHEARPGALGGVPAARLAVAAGLAITEAPA